MPFVIAGPCVADYSCVEVCPVNCIEPRPDTLEFGKAEQLYINPKICINCEACVEACPVNAIFEAKALPDEWKDYARINAEYFQQVIHE